MSDKERYLRVVLLGGAIKLNAFKNKDRTDQNRQPHFKGDGIAVWVNEKKPKEVTDPCDVV